MNVDVVVVGGGIVGKSAAIELAKSGAQVSIVDAGINSGSDANAGLAVAGPTLGYFAERYRDRR